MKSIYIFFILCAIFLFFPVVLQAAEQDAQSYLFHLYFDNGKLVIDRDYSQGYEIITEAYEVADEKELLQLNHTGHLVSFKGNVSAIFKFEPALDQVEGSIIPFTEGKITVSAPYVYNTDKVDFYSPSDELLLSISVRKDSSCNENGVCESEESAFTCPSDCREATVSHLRSNQSKNVRNSLIYFGVGVVVIIGGVWLLRRLKGNLQGPTSTV